MNSREINGFLRRHPLTKKIFRGVYSCDNIPKIRDGLFVLNTLPRRAPLTKIGHWVCFLVNEKITYFDPTGLPEIEIAFDCKIDRNEKVIQSMFTLNCGLYILHFALSMTRGYTLKEFLRQFGPDLIKNDAYVLCKMMMEYKLKKYYKIKMLEKYINMFSFDSPA
jgi:hypothetical protein